MLKPVSKSLLGTQPLLYWDSFKRMAGRQQVYWILNKHLKPIISRYRKNIKNGRDSSLNRILADINLEESWGRLGDKPSDLLQNLYFDNREVTSATNGFHPVNIYWEMLTDIFQSIIKEDEKFETLSRNWLQGSESEEDHNFYRFHLFPKYLAGLPDGGEYAKKLISAWIDLEKQLPDHAFDPFNIAIRLINWLKLLPLFSENTGADKELTSRIINSIVWQTKYLQRNIQFEITGNHVLLELYCLWLIGYSMQPLKSMKRLMILMEKHISREISAQFDESGFYKEHSIHYHIQSTLIALNWLYGMRSLNRPIDNDTMSVLREATAHALVSLLPDGSIPVLGDKCYSIFNMNILDDIEAIKRLSVQLFGERAAENPEPSYRELGSSYCVHQNRFLKIIIDVGNIGQKENPGHGHSDILSFILSSKTAPILIDAGTSTYCDYPGGCLCKKAAYHNTLSIDGHDQAYLWGNFRWAYLPKGLTNKISHRGGHFNLVGRYRGFRHIGSFVHSRTFDIWEQYLTIKDAVEGRGHHDLFFSFILHPQWQPNVSGNDVILSSENDDSIPCIKFESPCELKIEPIFVFPEYNFPVSSNRIEVCYRNKTLPFKCETAIDLG